MTRSKQSRSTSTAVADKADTFAWNGTWNEFLGKVKKTWGSITDDDLQVVEGSFQQVIGKVQKQTGDTLENIHRRLFQ